VLLITAYFLEEDPALIRRRLAAGPIAERRRAQKVVQALASFCFVALFVVSGLDRRFGWSSVPMAVSLAADVIVAAGFGIVFLVFRENSHTSAVIEVSAGQRLVSTGPYRHVRHPMYAGALLLLAATPLALGSVVALPLVLALAGVLVARILDEERLLSAELPGYTAYRRAVRYRLLPHVW
jgi:protein-S-isoprenylcysteine O-methyltransferase Ste14